MNEGIEPIVISEDHYNALGVIRGLGLAGMKIHLLLMAEGPSYVDASKYVTDCKRIHRTEAAFAEAVQQTASNPQCVYPLFPLSDFAAQASDQCRHLFGKHVAVPHMKGKMGFYSDKCNMKQWAREQGLHVPMGKILELPGEGEDWNVYPAIVKPLVSVEGAKADIQTAASHQEMRAVLQAYFEKGYQRVLAEQYISGEQAYMVEVLGERSQKRGCRFAGIIRKIREYPLENGSTSYGEIIGEQEGLNLDLLSGMLDAVEWEGLFDVEFKFADGKLYFIECNFRNGAPSWAFTKKGINLPVMWIEDIIGRSIEARKLSAHGAKFMCEQNDMINMFKGTPKFRHWIREFLFSYKIFWYSRDIKPALRYYRLLAGGLPGSWRKRKRR